MINFTKEHFERMKSLLLNMLLNNNTIQYRMTVLDVQNLLHTTTINTLNNCRLELQRAITNLENQDEWATSDYNQKKLEELRNQKELVNLVIGYKRFLEERERTKVKKESIMKQINDLKESQKTPEDKIKELENQLNDLSSSTTV